MPGIIERSYGRACKAALKAVNPIKRKVVKTECQVHKFINNQSVIVLKNDGFCDTWSLADNFLADLNLGVVWADQDLKSRNHFYNPARDRGLYGFSNALKECMAYYTSALTWWKRGNVNKAIFYLGAACHLLQDVTVPQHINIKLLKQHRKYEKWVKEFHEGYELFKCQSGGIYLSNIRQFIEENARIAIYAYESNKHIKDLEEKFFNITGITLCQAQRSTAGFIHMFYNDISSIRTKGTIN